ncbi:RecQ family ATP-dependent DNA helicase [Lacticaseibacillus jixianensis]|uniref:RecQ family ATP-dependent DNA helicase n=1 Tax=Lacticaseibacillus jixianensis TaxID=2486012 RepID=A0ABW4B9F3_9LACO|nr:RecQ family ATP-dependent DNA helicase [Lacticaseibacillus jixianensis]
MPDLKAVLRTEFGFKAFRPGQQAIIEAVLEGTDVLGVLPTGSGKTLCYQLPGRLVSGLVVVVEPLLALMEDQVARLQASGEKRVVALSSRLTPAEFSQVLGSLAAQRFLFLAPETLGRPDVIAQLRSLAVSLFVVDEAHCISQWGPDFRPAYLRLGEFRAALQPRATLALTATAPLKVQQDIITGLRLLHPKRLITSVDRPNLFLGFETVAGAKQKEARALALVQQIQGPKILYFDRKKEAERYAGLLQAQGVAAAYYHAGLDALQRDLIQRQFMADQVAVICATSAFGMGIDKPDVRLVLYLHLPESLEAYSQGIGRAGRDGENSATLVLLAPEDLNRASQFAASLPDAQLILTIFKHPSAYKDFTDPQVALIEAYIQAGFSQAQVERQLAARRGEKQASFQAIAALAATGECKRTALLRHFDSTGAAHTAFCCGAVTSAVLAQLAPAAPVRPRQADAWRAIFAQLFNK